MRPQKPRFFAGGFGAVPEVLTGGAASVAGSATGAGSYSAATGGGCGTCAAPNPRIRLKKLGRCTSQYSMGSVPVAKYCRRWLSQLSVASLPDNGQMSAVSTPAGGDSHCGASPRVASSMKRVHNGTATDAANAFRPMVRGAS